MRSNIEFRLVIVALLAASAVTLAACGDKQSGQPAAPAGSGSVEPVTAGDAKHGKELFITCAACHGPDAKGLPNLGKDLTTSTFVAEKTDAELVAFLKVGREAADPLNTTGVAMPPRGGNPVLTDADLADLAAYVRELQAAN